MLGNSTIALGVSGDPTKRAGVDKDAWGPVNLGTR